MEEIKTAELRDPDYYGKNRELLGAMLKYAFEHRIVRLNSGLVEQQRLFMEYRRKKLKVNEPEGKEV